jgi:hypothetical protein
MSAECPILIAAGCSLEGDQAGKMIYTQEYVEYRGIIAHTCSKLLALMKMKMKMKMQ